MSALQFLPWLRTGLAARLPEHLGGALPATASLTASVTVDGVSVQQTLRLHGPGAVTRVRAVEFARCEPADGSLEFESNLLPFVELNAPDLPWRYTPVGPDGDGRIRPWLVLVVIEETNRVRLEPGAMGQDLVIDSGAADQLPDLGESWAWAHVQLAGPISSQAELDQLLGTRARECRSRLLCARRLADDTAYLAAVVPAFQQGVEAASERDPERLGETLLDAWEVRGEGAANAIRLPVYHSWRFRTASTGDFESLIRRLQPVALPEDTGVRRLDLTDSGPAFLSVDHAATRYLGALHAPSADPTWEPDASMEVAIGDALDETIAASDDAEPVVGPPVWGERLGDAGAWQRHLNRHPTWRAVAALGAATVRSRQEHWMAEAWEQAGQLRQVQVLVNRARLASGIGERLRSRLDALGDDELVAFARALGKRVTSSSSTSTVAGALARSALPHGLAGGGLRRAVRVGGPVRRALRTKAATGGTGGGASSLLRGARTGTLQVADTAAFRPAPDRRVVEADAFGGTSTTEEVVDLIATYAPRPMDASVVGVVDSFRDPTRTSATRRAEPDGDVVVRAAADLRAAPLPGDAVWERLGARVSGSAWSLDRRMRRVRVSLSMPASLQRDLVALDPDWLLPGAGALPAESVGLLAADARFVEAFLVGANHEIRNELAWRGLPVPPNTTPFLHFWTETRADLAPVPWTAGLGSNAASGSNLTVFVIRGALVRRYPEAICELVRAGWLPGTDGEPRRFPEPTVEPLQPVFRGTLAADTLFVGFAVAPQAAGGEPVVREGGVVAPMEGQGDGGWFLRISEPPAGPRFGLDLEEGAPALPDGGPVLADGLSWAHVAPDASGRLAVTGTPLDGREVEVGGTLDGWAATSAALATQLTQRPVRMLVHASYLLGGS